MLCARTERATQPCQHRTQSNEPASLQVPCPCRVSFSSASRCSHCRARHNEKQAARRQLSYACSRNALTTTVTNTIRSTLSSNVSLTSSLMRATEHHVTCASASTADANCEPTKWALKPPAKGEAQQLGFTVCNPAPCPQSGHQNRTQNKARKHC